MLTIDELSAVEILDSRAHPTLAVTVTLPGGATARAGVFSGASTGSREARGLAVGTGCGQIKSGAPARGERTAKYNRLVEIESVERLSYGLTG